MTIVQHKASSSLYSIIIYSVHMDGFHLSFPVAWKKFNLLDQKWVLIGLPLLLSGISRLIMSLKSMLKSPCLLPLLQLPTHAFAFAMRAISFECTPLLGEVYIKSSWSSIATCSSLVRCATMHLVIRLSVSDHSILRWVIIIIILPNSFGQWAGIPS